MSFYIAKAIESIKKIKGLEHQITPMGTLLEAENIEIINEAVKRINETVHNLGIYRVEMILKIDSRTDKQKKLSEKLESVKKYLD